MAIGFTDLGAVQRIPDKTLTRNNKPRVIKIQFGDTTGLSAKINDREAARSFAARHQFSQKTDKTKAGYWACRLPRYGLVKGGKWW